MTVARSAAASYDGSMIPDAALERFAAELEGPIDLARAALLIGEVVAPKLDVDAYLSRLDEMAEAAASRHLTPVDTIASLFEDTESGLRGDPDEYYEPANSFLHQVLERRLGIPISLSVIAMEVGRRLGIQVEGVPFPGHFMIRVRSPGDATLLDPFGGGERVSDADLLLRLRAVTGRIAALGPRELGPASPPQILTRMLLNLKAMFLRQGVLQEALGIQERLLVLRPEDRRERRDRGLLYARLGRAVEAEADLTSYLEAMADAEDADAVRQVIEHVREKLGPLN